MSKTCPSCGYRETDMQAMYCNKCGYPFPPSQQRRPAAVPAPAATRSQPSAPRASRRRPPKRGGGAPGGFGRLITESHLKLIYLAGAALIMLLAILGIAGMFGKAAAGGANMSVTNLTAVADRPAASPLFWVGFLLAGSILWRMFCEIFVLLVRAPGGMDHDGGDEEDTGEYGGEEDREYGGADEGTMVECPKCHRIVPADDLRECEHCGIQGCSTCIRSMGLIRKTLTCRECYEGS